MKLVEPTDNNAEPEIPRTAQVVRFNGVTKLELDPDVVLQSAIGKLKTVVVLGFAEDDSEWFAASMSDGADVLWHLERARLKILTVGTDTPIV